MVTDKTNINEFFGIGKKMNHKQKLKLARRLLTPEDRKNHVHPFESRAWATRKSIINGRILIQQKEVA